MYIKLILKDRYPDGETLTEKSCFGDWRFDTLKSCPIDSCITALQWIELERNSNVMGHSENKNVTQVKLSWNEVQAAVSFIVSYTAFTPKVKLS